LSRLSRRSAFLAHDRCVLLPPSPRSTLFPYTTLFRSRGLDAARASLDGNGGYHRVHRGVDDGHAGGALVGHVDECRSGGSGGREDRKSTRLNSSHVKISYAVFCLKKKKNKINRKAARH